MSEKINRSVARALEMLELVAASKDELTITEISKQLGIPKSTTFDILYTLLDKGYLEQANEKQKSFKLGVKLFQTGACYLEQTPFQNVAHLVLEKLAEVAGETAFLALLNNDELVYFDKVESPNSVRTSARIGSNNPLYCTGLGKAILATLPDEDVKTILARTGGLKPITPYTCTDETKFFTILNQARQQGYAIDDREHNAEVFCLAAPVYNLQGKVYAAISVASLYTKIKHEPEKIAALGKMIADAALDLSQRIGYRGPRLYADF
ncbi:IclR family transcriptional regulator [Enterobacter sp. Colony194]|uniref:IclR family transcriptional regulator n=1 Tax=Enterobacter sp. Colony194 TaxID=2866201 RepID=UPI001C6963A5|nr:IclR family transcriptional regulator [Enterobacter sp. Colony194]